MSTQQDLPPHVPSCVSTGDGVTVPDAAPDATATPSETPMTDFAVASCSIRVPRPLQLTCEQMEKRLYEALNELVAKDKEHAATLAGVKHQLERAGYETVTQLVDALAAKDAEIVKFKKREANRELGRMQYP